MPGLWPLHRLLVFCGVCVLAISPLAVAAEGQEPPVQEQQEGASEDANYYELMKLFVDSFEQIERNYVKDIDRRVLVEAAIKGMMEELDQYSSYISPEELSNFNQQVEQEFGGIGVQMDARAERLTVLSPLPGTPAYRAGILAGDVIMQINGESTEGFTIADAVRLLKGAPGEKVTLGVRRAGAPEDQIEQIDVVRDVIRTATVLGDYYKSDGEWEYMIDSANKIAYIRLTHFSRRSTEELHKALEQLTAQDVKGLVLDLRFNPGGLLSAAVEIADMFVESGKIVSTAGRNTRERVWEATKEGTYSGFPIAILVNRYSASASEIVSACLQDHNRAVIIGERTWGKGSVQNVIDLEEGTSALKLTTASYHRPNGHNIHKFPGAKDEDEWGVMPNEGYKIESSNEEMQEYLRYRRERDVLSKNGPPKDDFEDKQLAKALEYLREKPAAGEEPVEAKRPGDEAPKEEPATSRIERKSDRQAAQGPLVVGAPII